MNESTKNLNILKDFLISNQSKEEITQEDKDKLAELSKNYIRSLTVNLSADQVYNTLFQNKGFLFPDEVLPFSDLYEMVDSEGAFRKELLANKITQNFGNPDIETRSLSKDTPDAILKRYLDEIGGNLGRDEDLKLTAPKGVSAALGDTIYKSAVRGEGPEASLGASGTGGTNIIPSYGIPFKDTEWGEVDAALGVPDAPGSNIPAQIYGHPAHGPHVKKEDPMLYDFDESGDVNILDILQGADWKDSDGDGVDDTFNLNRYTEHKALNESYEAKKAILEEQLENKRIAAEDQSDIWDAQTGYGLMNLWKSGEPMQWFGNTISKIVTAPLNILDIGAPISNWYDTSMFEYNPETGEWGDKKYQSLVKQYFAIQRSLDSLEDKYDHVTDVYSQDVRRAQRTGELRDIISGGINITDPNLDADDLTTGIGFMQWAKDEDGEPIFNTEDIQNILTTKGKVK